MMIVYNNFIFNVAEEGYSYESCWSNATSINRVKKLKKGYLTKLKKQ